MAVTKKIKKLMNTFRGAGQAAQLGSALQAQKGHLCALYDFSVHGGAQGSIELDNVFAKAVTLPANAIVTNVWAEELTDVTSGGSATVTLNAGSTALTGATGYASFAGITSVALAGAVAGIKVSADSDLKITIGTADITAGKIRFHVEYMISEETSI